MARVRNPVNSVFVPSQDKLGFYWIRTRHKKARIMEVETLMTDDTNDLASS